MDGTTVLLYDATQAQSTPTPNFIVALIENWPDRH